MGFGWNLCLLIGRQIFVVVVKIFFLMWTIFFKAFIEFVTVLFLFYVFCILAARHVRS